MLNAIHLPIADELSDKPQDNGPLRYFPIAASGYGSGEEKGNWNLNEKSDGLFLHDLWTPSSSRAHKPSFSWQVQVGSLL